MRIMRFVGAALCGLAMLAAIPAEAGQQAAPAAGVCGASSYCYDANNFTATVTTFRVSTNNVYKQKIIDVTVRFQNKTTQAVVLAYVDHSGLATDDRGNRSIPWGQNAYRGIGLVSGTTFDPKLVVRPGAWGDAQFELVQQGTPPVTGMSYVLDLTIDEINNSGGQPTLGGEFPVHFEGLANGAAGTVPTLSGLAGGPCALQPAANKAASAANAISNLGSLFGKKKTAQTAGQVAAATAGCDVSANTTASTSGTIAATTASAATQPGTPATAANANEVKAKNPLAANTTPAHTSGDASSASGQAAQPWTPPSDVAEEKTELKDPLALPEVAKMPDVVGVRLGMSEPQAVQILHGQYPRERFQEIPASGLFPTNPKADYGFNILPTGIIETDAAVSLTAPPSRQVVWRVVRFTRGMHTNHANVLAALRAKYGKETLAGLGNGTVTTDDRSIGKLFWAFDEHGNRVQLPSPQTFGETSYRVIPCANSNVYGGPLSDVGPRTPIEENKSQDWCASVVGILISIDASEIVDRTMTNMVDMRLATRTANAYLAWKRDTDAKARAAAVEQSKKNKPVF